MHMNYSLLLDVITPGSIRRPRIVIDRPPKPIVEIDPQPVDSACCDSMNCCHGDSLAAAQNFLVGPGTGGDDMTMMWAGLFVVFLALALCFYFIYSYRRLLTPGVK